ncbi:unnamed protein product [Psylliodes chrysocephalus]|uniref:Uncharacterized protein n=1 Tax=Psylliodes chrysocephalus TaxID=3402493 RepID=A0A9P0D7T3_9CUCU|nr:unnamed protein product [Psylliodes chrysocephala]
MQLKQLLVIMTVLICLYAVSADLNKEEQAYLDSIFDPIPVEQRKYVLLHQLYLGYIQENPHITPKEWDFDLQDTKKIYNIFVDKLKVVDKNKHLKSVICFPDGRCIDPNDSGVYPG